MLILHANADLYSSCVFYFTLSGGDKRVCSTLCGKNPDKMSISSRRNLPELLSVEGQEASPLSRLMILG